ncbi:NTP transferase domain-containing protein [Candidatus Woesearchaeota archaeon]|jgi:L-glutamine-phosphate cytidylyltransferase|nr:NTP transferase domain-containing protein [Candidatus Woesearchaeota archaeon]MBT4110574.1 NTP transferase domain-containing protein [Candidatus Woesearchaeota archaeon]MBT4335902.1 NTP transferase domain-containing protein [Candidatus Woesearchaeota archaeon]MBT4469119.1 NTP transferase domain-containing protein [Candidatus Woesearchaeota archaeon]MBT6744562.1 NTP transferase domain-containing protein [Candidatus Woesearchaeota archaeon]
MKALITAAGMGTRLGNITKDTNKCILNVGNKPLLLHSVEILKNVGIDDIYVIIGHHGEKIKQLLGDKVNYIYNPDYATTSILGSIVLAKEHLFQSEFVFLTGDSLLHPELIKGLLEPSQDVLVSIELKKCNEEDMKVVLENHNIKEISKTISLDQAQGEYTSLTRFPKESSTVFFNEVEKAINNQNCKTYVADILLNLQNLGFNLKPIYTNKPRIEIDFLEDLEKAQALYKQYF